MANTAEDSENVTDTVQSSVVSPIPTPTCGNSGVFSIRSSVIIHAPTQAVFKTATDFSNFPAWNTFVPRVVVTTLPTESGNTDGKIQVGTEMTFHVCMKGKDTSTREANEKVTVFEELSDGRKGYRSAWKSLVMGLKAERVQEVVEIDAGDPGIPKSARTEYRSWETFGGPVAYVIKLLLSKALVARFADWSSDLKSYCEQLEAEGHFLSHENIVKEASP